MIALCVVGVCIPFLAGKEYAEKPYDVFSGVRTPGSNPVYDGSVGGHLQPAQSTATAIPEHQLDNALYTLDTQTEVYYSSADQPPQLKSGSVISGQHPGSNPVYDDEDLGGHLPLGKSATAAGGPEHQLDNPLYTMEAQTEVYYSSADQPPQHKYDYASTGSLPPATGPLALPTSTAPHQYDYASLPPEEGELYDAPDVAPRPRPQQPQLTYDYAEPPAGTVGSPKAVYDAPLLAEEPATISHDYDYADTPNVEQNTSSNATPPDVPGQ